MENQAEGDVSRYPAMEKSVAGLGPRHRIGQESSRQ